MRTAGDQPLVGAQKDGPGSSGSQVRRNQTSFGREVHSGPASLPWALLADPHPAIRKRGGGNEATTGGIHGQSKQWQCQQEHSGRQRGWGRRWRGPAFADHGQPLARACGHVAGPAERAAKRWGWHDGAQEPGLRRAVRAPGQQQRRQHMASRCRLDGPGAKRPVDGRPRRRVGRAADEPEVGEGSVHLV